MIEGLISRVERKSSRVNDKLEIELDAKLNELSNNVKLIEKATEEYIEEVKRDKQRASQEFKWSIRRKKLFEYLGVINQVITPVLFLIILYQMRVG